MGPVSPHVAFVLGGGGVLGASQVGMARALAEASVRPDLVLGTSIGALNGAFLAASPDVAGAARLEDVWRKVTREGLFTQRPVRQVAGIARHPTHVLTHAALTTLMERYLPATSFADLEVPFQCVAAQIEGARAVWFDHGPVVPPVLASCSVPGLFPPVRIEGAHYLDGGLVHSIPVGRAVEMGATEIYVLQVGRVEQPLSVPTRAWEVAQVAFEISRRHRFVDEIDAVPESVTLHVLPTGSSNAPTIALAQARRGRMNDRMEAAYAATTTYLQGREEG